MSHYIESSDEAIGNARQLLNKYKNNQKKKKDYSLEISIDDDDLIINNDEIQEEEEEEEDIVSEVKVNSKWNSINMEKFLNDEEEEDEVSNEISITIDQSEEESIELSIDSSDDNNSVKIDISNQEVSYTDDFDTTANNTTTFTQNNLL